MSGKYSISLSQSLYQTVVSPASLEIHALQIKILAGTHGLSLDDASPWGHLGTQPLNFTNYRRPLPVLVVSSVIPSSSPCYRIEVVCTLQNEEKTTTILS